MRRLTAIAVFCITVSFMSKDEVNCTTAPLQTTVPFRVGVAINTEKLKYREKYWKTALTHFNSFTPEKILKPEYLHPDNGKFEFYEADRLMEFCAEKKIRLHGHTLIWDKAIPQWMSRFRGEPAEWESMMKTHVQEIVRHCSKVIRSWDVVNEAFNDDGTLKDTKWKKQLGESYIGKAFRYAAEADPSVLLFYNDYNLERNDRKLTAVLNMLTALRGQGVKIDGIGMQMHVSLDYPAISDINAAAKRISDAGFLVHYSELDVSLSQGHGIFEKSSRLFALQRTRMQEIVKGFMQINPAHQFGITIWGVSDDDSWLSEDHFRARPTLFDKRYNPKPALCGFIEGAKQAK